MLLRLDPEYSFQIPCRLYTHPHHEWPEERSHVSITFCNTIRALNVSDLLIIKSNPKLLLLSGEENIGISHPHSVYP